MYIKVTNDKLEYPYAIHSFRKENPQTSFPKIIDESTLNSFNIFKVDEVTPPHVDPKTQAASYTIEYQNNKWVQIWEVRNLPDYIAAKNIREARSSLLGQSDWTQLKDVPLEISSEWALYRQALRDIPQQTGFPYDVEWPIPPAND